MTLVVVYDPVNGESVPDGKIYAWVKEKIVLAETQTSSMTLTVSSSLIIEEIRALIAEDAISNNDITFIFRGEEIHPEIDGGLAYWPGGFCDIYDNILERLL